MPISQVGPAVPELVPACDLPDQRWRDVRLRHLADMSTGNYASAEFHADDLGMTARLNLSDSFVLRVNGIGYDYSRDIRIQPDIDILRFFSASRLSLVNSLLDYRVSAGLEYRFGMRSVDLTFGNWRTAVDQTDVDSITVGFLTPMTTRTDIEFRFSFDDSERWGRTTALTVYLYYFGGS